MLLQYPLPAAMNPLPAILFTTKKNTDFTTEAVIGANKAARSSLSYLFISFFVASVTPSIYTSEYSDDFTILIISSISSFKMDKVNHFPALIVPFSLILFLNLSIEFKVLLKAIFLTNAGKLFLGKEIARSLS